MTTFKLIRLLKNLVLFFVVVACEKSHALVSNLESPNVVPEVEVLFPGGTYVSDDTKITIFGNCISGATVVIEEYSRRATQCFASQFSFEIKKKRDGNYVFNIWQIVDGNESSSVLVNWVRHSEY